MTRSTLAVLAPSLAFLLGADLPPADAVKPVEVVRTNDYSEGVVVDHEGSLYFSHGKVVSKLPPGGKLDTWAETGSPNGHKILANGHHLICDASRHAVLHLDEMGRELEPAAKESDGRPLRGPNDLTLDPEGGFYFTDPGESGLANPIGTVHFTGPDEITHTVATGLAFPNGVVLRPGGKELLVGESQKNRILAYPVVGRGKLGEPRVFAELPAKGEGQSDNQPDGIALDAEGNLYVAHYGMGQVQVLDPKGKLIRRYPGGNLLTSNVAFAGPDLDQLYVTGGEPGALYRLDLKVKGYKILPSPASDADVTGKISVNGKPLREGSIRLVPADPDAGREAEGKIQDGAFRLTPVVGRGGQAVYRVVITAPDGVPARYGFAEQSGLTVQIRPGANMIDFNLNP